MTLTTMETMIIIAMVVLGTMITRYLPFAVFREGRGSHPYVVYLGKTLPCAAIGLLVVYCLKNVNLAAAPHGLPEAAAVACVVVLHWWKNNAILSIGAGTAVYMLLVQKVFI